MDALGSGGRWVLTLSRPLIHGGVGWGEWGTVPWPAGHVVWLEGQLRADTVSGSGLAEAIEMTSGCRGPGGAVLGPRAGLLLPGLLPVCLPWALSQNTFSRTALRMYEVTSVLSDSATPWTVARQAPWSMVFSRQEYWSGSPCPLLQGIFLTQGSNPGLFRLLHWQAGLHHWRRLGSPRNSLVRYN